MIEHFAFTDLERMRDSVRAYRTYRKARGLPPPEWFEQKIMAGRRAAGFNPRAVLPDEEEQQLGDAWEASA